MVLRPAKVTEVEKHPATEGRVPDFHFSTEGGAHGSDAWRELVAVLFDFVAERPLSPLFHANLTARHFGRFLLCRSFAGGGRYSRGSSALASNGLDHVVVSCVTAGRIGVPGGRTTVLRAGDVTVVDLSSLAHFRMAAAEALHLIVPRVSLPPAVAPVSSFPFRRFSRSSATAILIRGVMESLWQASQHAGNAEMAAFSAALPEMLGWCLGGMPPAIPVQGDANLARRLRRHIEQNLHHADLGPSRLQRDIAVSRSGLYRQFSASGGVEAYIRQRRLRRALLALTDPVQAERRIGDIAYDVGFTDEAHFSRLFRRAFGCSPRDARKATGWNAHLPSDDRCPPMNDAASFARWLALLGLS